MLDMWPVASAAPLRVQWRRGLTILNLRGSPEDAAFRDGVAKAVGVELPLQACTTSAAGERQLVWAGPDDWFFVAPGDGTAALVAALDASLQGLHHAVTDVGSGYTVLRMQGAGSRPRLAQGCPLDLHPRVFHPGTSAGSHFFKASICIWMLDDAPTYDILVRSSFRGYVELLLNGATGNTPLDG